VRASAFKLGLGLLLALIFSASAHGADVAAAKGLMNAFQQASNQWIGPLQQVATWLLISLATISLVWKFGLLALQQADFQEFVVELVRMILFVGFFLAVIQHADVWSKALIEGFAWLANYASGAGGVFDASSITPAAVLHRGMSLSVAISEAATGWASTLTYFLLGVAIVVIYALIAAYVLLVFCESYFVTTAGVILLGFGGNQWTNDYATRYLTYCVSVGMKLFVTLLVVGIGEQLVYNWALAAGDWGNLSNVFSVLGVLLLLVILVWMLPNIIQGVVNGSSLGGGAGSFGAVAGLAGGAAMGAGAMAAGGAKTLASGTTAVMEAAKLAQPAASGLAAGLGTYAAPGLKTATMIGETAKTLGGAAATAIGSSLRGDSKLAQAVHAARMEVEKKEALSAVSGVGGGTPAGGLGGAAKTSAPKSSTGGTGPATGATSVGGAAASAAMSPPLGTAYGLSNGTMTSTGEAMTSAIKLSAGDAGLPHNALSVGEAVASAVTPSAPGTLVDYGMEGGEANEGGLQAHDQEEWRR